MGYSKLFWGFIFLFDFRLNGFDILPDIIGYIFFYQGLSLLQDKNDYFSKGKGFALPMIFISIFDIFQVTIPIDQLGNTSFGLFSIILGLVITVINLLMVYNICYGIKSEARLRRDVEVESQSSIAWNVYLITNILLSLSFILLGIFQFLFIILFVISIISYILMLRLMSVASNKL